MAENVAQAKATVLELTAKRAIDLTLAVVAVAVLAPVMVVICLLVRWDSRGPILFSRQVTGHLGKPFVVYKFRTMAPDAHDRLATDPRLLSEYQANLKIPNDPRITRVGRLLRKTSLDELPQFFNVIKGDMSLVGPRMLGDLELEKYGADKYAVLGCKPGITGLWQVSGRQAVSFERRRQLDLAYVHDWSLWLDLKILVKTIPAVVSGVGAN